MQNHDRNEIERIIREAFAGVVLGEKGVGLWEGQVLDDWCAPESVENYQAKHEATEEREDWSRIPVADLNDCFSSFSFFNAEGMRFHLPAFLIAELRGEMHNPIFFFLAYDSDHTKKQFSALNKQQRMAVRAFLLFVQDDILGGGTRWSELDLPHLERALAGYWVET